VELRLGIHILSMSRRQPTRERHGNAGGDRVADRRPTAATPIAFVQTSCGPTRNTTWDPLEALRLARIVPSDLRRAETLITTAQLETFTQLAMRQLDDEALGWFCRKLPWGSYGMLCRASLTAPDLVSLSNAGAASPPLNDDILLDCIPKLLDVLRADCADLRTVSR